MKSNTNKMRDGYKMLQPTQLPFDFKRLIFNDLQNFITTLQYIRVGFEHTGTFDPSKITVN